MKFAGSRSVFAAVLLVSVLSLFSVPVPAQAQSLGMRVKIPFEFHVGNTAFPAGTYTFTQKGEALRISDTNGHNSFVISNAVPNPESTMDSQLVFHRYGEDRFLSVVRWSGYRNAREVPKGSVEKEISRSQSSQNVLTAAVAR